MLDNIGVKFNERSVDLIRASVLANIFTQIKVSSSLFLSGDLSELNSL